MLALRIGDSFSAWSLTIMHPVEFAQQRSA
jgi:hypothetical protein